MIVTAAILVSLAGSAPAVDTPAPPPPAVVTRTVRTPGDPFERMNRRFFAFNDRIDRMIFGPSARIYKRKAPNQVQHALHNFFVNLGEPVVAANDALQLRPKRTLTTLFRFVTNSTVGVAGFFDIAHNVGAVHHDNTFGTTLGRYGVPAGPYLYLPLVGPSDVRDTFGGAVDSYVIDPMNWVGYKKVKIHAPIGRKHTDDQNRIPYRNTIRTGLSIVGGIVARAGVEDDLNAIMSTATDPYATFRSLYLQSRSAAVRDSRWRHSQVPDYDIPDMTVEPAGPAQAQPSAAEPAATPTNDAPASPNPETAAPAPASPQSPAR